MKLEKWAQIAEITGSVAIVVTLIVLVVELRGNTAALQAANLQSLASRTQDLSLLTATTPELAAVQAKFLEQSVEDTRDKSYLVTALKIAEEAYLQYQAGLLDDEFWQTRANLALTHLQTERAREMYSQLKEIGVFASDFSTWLDEAQRERYGL